MDPQIRPLFNAAFTEARFKKAVDYMESRLGPIPFQVAETPLFMTHALRDFMSRSAMEIVAELSEPTLLAKLKTAIPAKYDVPGMDPLPNCVQVDFAVTQNGDGSWGGKVVELQAFPSLYALMTYFTRAWTHALADAPGLGGDWSCYLGRDEASALELVRQTLLGGEAPENVVLVDIEPEKQKTAPDFEATRQLFGVDPVCVTKLIKEGRRLFRMRDGKKIQVKRIYNRMVFDELEVKKVVPPFDWNEELDVTWCSHPNWYWPWSKFSLPHLKHAAVPRAQYLDELKEIPTNLEAYVLKPLFSFAGAGVVVDVTPEAIAKVPAEQRHGWVLQEKIRYADAIRMPDGNGVKAEVRVMLMRPPEAKTLEPLICLVRLSRGKMLGVDFNKGLTWVGGSIGLWRP